MKKVFKGPQNQFGNNKQPTFPQNFNYVGNPNSIPYPHQPGGNYGYDNNNNAGNGFILDSEIVSNSNIAVSSNNNQTTGSTENMLDQKQILISQLIGEDKKIENENSSSTPTKVDYEINLPIKSNDFYKYLITQQKTNNSHQQRLRNLLPKVYVKDCEAIVKKLYPDFIGDFKSKLFDSVVMIPLKIDEITEKKNQNEFKSLSLPILCHECHHCEVMDISSLNYITPNFGFNQQQESNNANLNQTNKKFEDIANYPNYPNQNEPPPLDHSYERRPINSDAINYPNAIQHQYAPDHLVNNPDDTSKQKQASSNNNQNQMNDKDASIVNPNILVKCTICDKCTDISKLFVEENLYRLLKFFDLSNMQKLKLLAIPKERFETVITPEDIIRYDKEMSHSLTNKLNLNAKLFAVKDDIFEVGPLELKDKQFIAMTLRCRNDRKDSKESHIRMKDNKMPKFWITINSFLSGNSLYELLNYNQHFEKNNYKILFTDLNRFKIACQKLSSQSIEPIMMAFSMACSIILGYCSYCLIDEINLSEFLVIYSFLKRMINLPDYNFNLLIFSKTKEKIDAETKEEPYCSFLKEVISPFKITLTPPESSNNIIISQMEYLLKNINQTIEGKQTLGSINYENIEKYFYSRIKSLNCFENFLGKSNSEFNLRNITYEQGNFRIVFKGKDLSKFTEGN